MLGVNMRDSSRINQEQIFQSFVGDFVTALLGPRRVGKTTLVEHFMAQHSNYEWVVFNMDKLDRRRTVEAGQLKQSIEKQVLRQLGEGKKVWVFIDEAQKCPALFDQVKLIYDEFKGKEVVKFILTGSALLSLHQLSAESLAGRIELFYLNEFTLKELVQGDGIQLPEQASIMDLILQGEVDPAVMRKHVDALRPFSDVLNKKLKEQLAWGGLPEVYEQQGFEPRMTYLLNYFQTYLEKDVRALGTISDLALYENLLEVVAQQTGSVRDDTKIKEVLGCSFDTLKKYRGYMLATLVYHELQPFIGSTLKRLIKSPKGYLLNNGLISYLTGQSDVEQLASASLIGHRFENWFYNQIKTYLNKSVKRNNLYYWRTSGGAEVDFVAEIKPEITPFEITYASRARSNKVNNLKRFMADYSQVQFSYYIYNGEFEVDIKNKIIYLPAWCLV